MSTTQSPTTVVGTRNLQPREVLHYLPEYQVVVCTLCKYAVQPNAISRHLKDIHHIHRSHRRPFMEYISTLTLKTPEDVVSSQIVSFPVPLLPVHGGLVCRACQHLCVSEKRMKSHMAFSHGRPGQASVDWFSASLQTFFRGNLLRYFTAPPNTVSAAEAEQSLSKSSYGGASQSYVQDILPLVSGPRCSRSSLGIKYSPNSSRTEMNDPTLDLKLNPTLNDIDLVLFQHYIASTCWSIADPETTYLWRTVVPHIASRQPFLLHGLLAVSALHLIYQQHVDIAYFVRASYHQNLAMPLFREAISNPTNENCDAILAFTHLLVIYSWAAEKQDERIFFVKNDVPELMPAWLFFIRTGCSMLCTVWDSLEKGPLAYLATSWDVPIIVSGDDRTPFIDSLMSIIPVLGSDDAWSYSTCQIYRKATMELGLAFRCVSTLGKSLTTWDALRIWPLLVSEDYYQLLNQHHPSALILLAHYCLLLQKLESRWYLEGRAKKLLSTIFRFLDQRWHCYIQWPLKDVGLL